MLSLKKSSRFIATALALVALPTGYLVIRAANGSLAAQTLLEDPMSVFSARSPGARGSAEFSTKSSYARSLSSARNPDGAGVESASLPREGFLAPPAPEAPEAAFDTPPSLGESSLSDIVQPVDGPGSSGPFSEPGGSFGGVVPPLLTQTPLGPDPVPPTEGAEVPEPETWLMMILGFLAIGSALRIRNRQHLKAQ